jgi:hypothetical protein
MSHCNGRVVLCCQGSTKVSFVQNTSKIQEIAHSPMSLPPRRSPGFCNRTCSRYLPLQRRTVNRVVHPLNRPKTSKVAHCQYVLQVQTWTRNMPASPATSAAPCGLLPPPLRPSHVSNLSNLTQLPPMAGHMATAKTTRMARMRTRTRLTALTTCSQSTG